MKSIIFLCRILFTFLFIVISAVVAGGEPQSTLKKPAGKLLNKESLVYEGAFRLPHDRYGSSSFDYGGTAITYYSAHNSLYLVGHNSQQNVAEIAVPEIKKGDAVSDLSIAKVLQPFSDITNGNKNKILKNNEIYEGDQVKIGGLLVYDDSLIGTVYGYYDAGGRAFLSHFISGTNFEKGYEFKGMYKVGETNQSSFVSGYMANIPKEWQPFLGGSALTGNAALSIIGRTSFGPSVFVFNPHDLGLKNPVPAKPLVYYPSAHPTLGKYDETNPNFNGTTTIKGVVFPVGSRSILFFGSHGTGKYCYGIGGKDGHCVDPANSNKGDHGYPYKYQVWAYDVDNLLRIRKENKNPWDATPYAVWNFDLPFQPEFRQILGAAYDPSSQRIFLSQYHGDNEFPVIHVFRISLDSDRGKMPAYLTLPPKN